MARKRRRRVRICVECKIKLASVRVCLDGRARCRACRQLEFFSDERGRVTPEDHDSPNAPSPIAATTLA
jgi:hypothetical protein